MGKTRTTQETVTTPSATPMEEELNRLEMERTRAVQPGMIGTQQAGLALVQQLLRGEELPGYLQELAGGISPETARGIAGEAVEISRPGFQALGLGDSGVAFEQQTRTAADILRGTEEFNIQNRLNMLQLALSGQASIQQPILGQGALLGQRLAGLRGMQTFGTAKGPNLFMGAFQQAAGGAVGKSLGGSVMGGGGSSGGGGSWWGRTR